MVRKSRYDDRRDGQPLLVNENVVGPDMRSKNKLEWKQFGDGLAVELFVIADRKKEAE